MPEHDIASDERAIAIRPAVTERPYRRLNAVTLLVRTRSYDAYDAAHDAIVGADATGDVDRGVRLHGMSTRVRSSLDDGVFVHESSYVDEECEIGSGTRIWHFSHVLRGSRIGADCNVGQNVMIGPDVTVGARCKLQNNVSVYPGVTLEDGVFCGPSCVFTNVINLRAEIERKNEFRPTKVGRGATIGANATIVCGFRIGAYALVGAGSVVAADVPAHALVVGVPARRIGWVSHEGHRLDDDLTCPVTGRRYRETGDGGLAEV
jgi:UDP-2-acetamido-3-amino-2,3-dideoxy-glucuronate N-acetyltransferase